jgi:SAM-dependent methyltransferase
MKNHKRGILSRCVSAVTLPLRALAVRERSKWFLISLRDERMEVVRKHCRGKVLDLGCGPDNIFIREYCDGVGIGADVFPYSGIDVLVSSVALPFPDEVFDTVTLIAVGGHIPRSVRLQSFKEISRILKEGGRLVLTEGEVVTQTIHHRLQFFLDHFRKEKNMDTVRGMEEDEEFAMPHKEIQGYLTRFFGNFERTRFQLGLNNVYLATKQSSKNE